MSVKPFFIICLFIFLQVVVSCNTPLQTERSVSKSATKPVPIQYQEKGIFHLGSNIYCSNTFSGARLNNATFMDDSSLVVLISPENSPINMSPWYAFKLWSEAEMEISLKITYPQGYYHRYSPKISHDGLKWQEVDSALHKISYDEKKRPVSGSLGIKTGPDTVWVAAQELMAMPYVDRWTDHLASKPYITKSEIGKSRDGKPIHSLLVGESNNKNMLLIISRQHPPEITGFKAMQSFVETISSDTEMARQFRNRFTTHIIPVVNPDGVNNGHWRHNSGGVDLNRDWASFNQPETSVVRNYARRKIKKEGNNLVFFMDFHSTWKDLYYIPYDREAGKNTELAYRMIELTGDEFPDYTPDIAKSLSAGKNTVVTSDGYFYKTYGVPSVNYEVGDNTSREFIKRKAEVAAAKLMKLLIEANPDSL